MKINFPDLKIIPVNRAILHEEIEPKRTKLLKQTVIKDGFLQDPPIVAKVENKFIVLDGANRVTVFRELKMPHILVQVVEYKKPIVELKNWNHLICDHRFKKYYSRKVKRFRLKDVKAMLNFVNLYNGRFQFYRVVGNSFKKLKKQYKNAVCLVIFPKFKSKNIIKFTTQGQKIPSGITRHLINGRALFVNFPLNILKGKHSIKRKNEMLKEFLSKRLKEKKVRYYAESLYIFNE